MEFSQNIVLASASPRRTELLAMAGIPHTVMTAFADEGSVKFDNNSIEKYVCDIARLKNDALFEQKKNDFYNEIIISADTVVFLPSEENGEGVHGSGQILGKPKSEEDAFNMLRLMSGKRHLVVTGVVIRNLLRETVRAFDEVSRVYFRELEDAEILRYVEEYKPLDKAGAYGIQEAACTFVRRIEGDYSNIVGLPAAKVVEELRREI